MAYLGALAALLMTSLWTQDDFTGQIERHWTLENFRDLSPSVSRPGPPCSSAPVVLAVLVDLLPTSVVLQL